MSKSLLRRACAASVAVAALAVVSSAPAQAAGRVTVKKVGTVNVRQAIAGAKHAQYRPALRNLPAAKQFAALEERRNSEEEGLRKAAPALKPPRVPGLPITSVEAQRGWEGLDIRDTVFSQGFEVEPPDQGLCGGLFQGTTYLFEETATSRSRCTTPRPTSTRRRPSASTSSTASPPAVDTGHRPLRPVPQ